MRETKVICFANNKGGSGKSTTCSNVGAALAGMGHRVLMIDGDMQLNLSLSFLDEETVLDFAKGERNLYQAIKAQKDLGAAKTSAYYAIAPFLGAGFGMLLLHERPGLQFYIGLVIMIIATLLMLED